MTVLMRGDAMRLVVPSMGDEKHRPVVVAGPVGDGSKKVKCFVFSTNGDGLKETNDAHYVPDGISAAFSRKCWLAENHGYVIFDVEEIKDAVIDSITHESFLSMCDELIDDYVHNVSESAKKKIRKQRGLKQTNRKRASIDSSMIIDEISTQLTLY